MEPILAPVDEQSLKIVEDTTREARFEHAENVCNGEGIWRLGLYAEVVDEYGNDVVNELTFKHAIEERA